MAEAAGAGAEAAPGRQVPRWRPWRRRPRWRRCRRWPPWPWWRRRCGVAAAVLSAVVVGLWLLDVVRQGEDGHAVPEALWGGGIVAARGAGAAGRGGGGAGGH